MSAVVTRSGYQGFDSPAVSCVDGRKSRTRVVTMFVVVRVVAGRPWEIVAECCTRSEAEWELSVYAERFPKREYTIDSVARCHR